MANSQFLIVFDGISGSLKEKVRVFGAGVADVALALEAYRLAEKEFKDAECVQVVLIASDSLETVQETHPNFWRSTSFKDLAAEALKP